MEPIRQITDELAIAGSIASVQLSEVVRTGFKSILNLRSSSEVGFPNEQKQQAKALELYYRNFPIDADLLTEETVFQILEQIGTLPKPTLLCCSRSVVAAAMALAYIATRQGASLSQALDRMQQLGLFDRASSQVPQTIFL
jgi:protein tyrosine phosphatase (PTP) superfamily phosphohydrolase (DUF442 family)